jgi:transposase
LQQVPDTGPVSALSCVLTIEDPQRFSKNRQVRFFWGLIPRRVQSGKTDKQLRINKAGNSYLRNLLVVRTQYIMGRVGLESKLCFFLIKTLSHGRREGEEP